MGRFERRNSSEGEKRAARPVAIFFWFVAYNAIEAFFTLYAQNHLGLDGSDGARLLGQLSLIFVLFALPAGYHRRARGTAQNRS